MVAAFDRDLLLAAVSVLAVRRARRGGSLLVGWLWYLGTLVPVIGIVQVGSQAWRTATRTSRSSGCS